MYKIKIFNEAALTINKAGHNVAISSLENGLVEGLNGTLKKKC